MLCADPPIQTHSHSHPQACWCRGKRIPGRTPIPAPRPSLRLYCSKSAGVPSTGWPPFPTVGREPLQPPPKEVRAFAPQPLPTGVQDPSPSSPGPQRLSPPPLHPGHPAVWIPSPFSGRDPGVWTTSPCPLRTQESRPRPPSTPCSLAPGVPSLAHLSVLCPASSPAGRGPHTGRAGVGVGVGAGGGRRGSPRPPPWPQTTWCPWSRPDRPPGRPPCGRSPRPSGGGR